MDDQKNNQNQAGKMDGGSIPGHPEGCMCHRCRMGNWCGHGYGCHGGSWGFRLFRILIALFIAGVVFWVGVRVGEFCSRFGGFDGRGGYGYSMMMRGGYGGYDNYGYGSGGAVPQSGGSQTAPAPTTP
ncbi:MAG TPA: hypothetical protein VNG29_01720 [Candidatus Paceibacterota bacterium]|nr:hypothetical protein [Candidatus Paceibacterota bacterium]